MRGGWGASEPRSPGAGGLGSAGARGAWVRCRLGALEPGSRRAGEPRSPEAGGAGERGGWGALEPENSEPGSFGAEKLQNARAAEISPAFLLMQEASNTFTICASMLALSFSPARPLPSTRAPFLPCSL